MLRELIAMSLRPFRSSSALTGLLLCWSLLLAGCETDGATSTKSNPRMPSTSSAALLRPGDNIHVTLQGIPDPAAYPLQIDDQGFINLPFIGNVNAAGRTASDLAQQIRTTYISREFYRTVDVSVSVTERFVYVGGEVQRPGRIIWSPDLTMTKAIQAAGGFTLYAKETAVNVVREQSSYIMDARLAHRSPAEDPPLLPGDSLQIDRSAF